MESSLFGCTNSLEHGTKDGRVGWPLEGPWKATTQQSMEWRHGGGSEVAVGKGKNQQTGHTHQRLEYAARETDREGLVVAKATLANR